MYNFIRAEVLSARTRGLARIVDWQSRRPLETLDIVGRDLRIEINSSPIH